MTKIAIIRLRGNVGIPHPVEKAMQTLKLANVNNCVLLEETPSLKRQLLKIKDYVTWGEIDEATEKELVEKRAEKGKKVFRLSPPVKGHARGGIKKPFTLGGALGNRKTEINKLVKKML